MKSKTTNIWEKEFNKEFKVYQSAFEEYGKVTQYLGAIPTSKENIIDFPVTKVKSFIKKQIQQAREEAIQHLVSLFHQQLEEIEEKIKKMREEFTVNYSIETKKDELFFRGKAYGHTEALSDVLQLLKERKGE